MSRIEEIKGRLSKIDRNMKVYQCSSYLMEKDEACGIYDGQSLDCSHDECHHPLSLDLAEYIVNTPADIQYLLTKLEQARETLQQIKYEYEQSQDDKVTSRMYSEAQEALKEICE